jgi:flagellar biosynthetic protein FliR
MLPSDVLQPGVIEAFGLYAARSSAMVISAPLIGQASGFSGYKVALIFGVALLMYSVNGQPLTDVEPILLGAMALREVLIGLFLSFLLHLSSLVIRVAGQLIGHEMGFMIASQVDPATGLQTPLITSMYETLFLLALLAVDGHFLLFRGLAESFERAPVGGLAFSQGLGAMIGSVFGDMFEAGLVFAAPVMALLFLVSLLMGLLSRAVPHLNVLELGFAIRILFALGVMYMFAPLLGPALERVFHSFSNALRGALDAMGATGG